MWRLALAVLPAVLVAGGVFAVTTAAPMLLGSPPSTAPAQPIAFTHQTHARDVGIDCAFCHRSAATSVAAGMPDLQQCIGCHIVIGQDQPEIEKVRQAWVTQTAVEWVRVHRLPDHTRFSHAAHVQANVECATCHGDVGGMRQVAQVRSLNMADCMTCHQQMAAPNECLTCHY
jgi:hypothetical protein